MTSGPAAVFGAAARTSGAEPRKPVPGPFPEFLGTGDSSGLQALPLVLIEKYLREAGRGWPVLRLISAEWLGWQCKRETINPEFLTRDDCRTKRSPRGRAP